MDYYRKHGRHALPWRPPALKLWRDKATCNPYAILVSEIMLQQTQVDRVIPKYQAWLKQFPTWQALAKASTGDVLKAWQGLGYNRRALMLKRAAQAVVEQYDGKLPDDVELLKQLPGIGPYTAGAVMAFAFNKPVPIIETNIRRAYIHHFFKNKTNVSDKEILPLISKTLLVSNSREWFQALMDYGANLPKTVVNPNRKSKHYVKQSKFEGSRRQIRGAILRMLAHKKSVTFVQVGKEFKGSEYDLKEIISDLVKEGFIKKLGHAIFLQ